MPDAQTAALLRAVLDEVCASVSPFDTATRTRVALHLLEKMQQDGSSLDDLKQVGRNALQHAPTMWL